MNLLLLILVHVITIVLFEVSPGSILWVMLLLLIDYCLIRIKLRMIRKGELRALFKPWFRKVGFIFNLLTVIMTCYLIYTEYFSSFSKQVNEQFMSCTWYKNEFSDMEKCQSLIPTSVKVPIVKMSTITDMLNSYNELKDACETDEELQSLQIQLQEDVKQKQLVLEDTMSSVERRIYVLYVWAILLSLYKLFWSWDFFVLLINRWKNLLSKKVVK